MDNRIEVDAKGFDMLVAAARKFIGKVERGNAVSTVTYRELVAALEALGLEQENNDDE